MYNTMTRAERRQQEIIEKERRAQVLRKIKFQKMKSSPDRIVKTFSQVKYAIGKYNPQNQVYMYKSYNGWSDNLQHAILYDTPVEIRPDDKPKGCRYGLSKVFAKVIAVFPRGKEELAQNHVERITLTKPNHYEMLSAVINNI